MRQFVKGDRVRYKKPRLPHIRPTFEGGGTVDLVQGKTIWVVLDGNGGRACYDADDLELETPDPSREEKPTGASRRIPFGARI